MNHIDTMKLALEALGRFRDWAKQLDEDAKAEGFGGGSGLAKQIRNHGIDDEVLDDAWFELDALAEQPAQQEPVAWGIIASNTGRICQVELDADEIEGHNPKYIVPLYTSPPPCPTCEALARTVMLDQTSHDAQRQWVGLTEEEHTQIAINCGCMSADWVFYGAAVERNLKEKNT